MPVQDITLDELMAACKAAGFTGDAECPGKSLTDLAKEWGCSKELARRTLTKAEAAGFLRVHRVTSKRIDGVTTRVPVYSFVFPKVAGKSKK